MPSTEVLSNQDSSQNDEIYEFSLSDHSSDIKDVINPNGSAIQELNDSVIKQKEINTNMEGEDVSNQESTEKNDNAAAVGNRSKVNQRSSSQFLTRDNSFLSIQERRLFEESPSSSPSPLSPLSPPCFYSSYQNEENHDYLHNQTREPINERSTIRIISPDGTLVHEITINPGQTIQVRCDHHGQVYIVTNVNEDMNGNIMNGNVMNRNIMNRNRMNRNRMNRNRMNRNRAAQRSDRRHRILFNRQQDMFFRNLIQTFFSLSVPEMRDIAHAILNGNGNNYLEQIRRTFPDTEVPTELRERMEDIYGYIYNRCMR